MDDKMTKEERGITDKLEFFFSEKIEVHFKLHKILPDGNRMFLNGFIAERSNKRVWLINENKLGNIRVAISEIKEVEEKR